MLKWLQANILLKINGLFSFIYSKKVGKLPVSHRYNRLPLLPSDSGGFQQELVAQDLPGAKVEKFSLQPNKKI